MAVAEVRFFSEALGRWTRYQVILPESGDGPFPVVIQLHGLGDDSRSWLERSNLSRYAEKLPLAIVLPDGETSAYINWQESERLHRQAFETLITQDIPNHIRRHFWVTSGPWGIGGLSMGGYGAMRIGLKYPEQFASIWAHSSAFVISERLDPDLVDPAVIGDADVLHHAEHLIQNRGHVPTISFDCGVDDELIEDNRRVHAQLEKIGLPHTYAEHPGDHTWEYWDIHVQSALMQHVEVLCKSQQSRS